MNRVQLDSLEVKSLRNIKQANLKPHPKFNVITGKNGMGKSNLVEGIYLLGALRSFRTSVRKELVTYGCEETKIKGIFGDINAGLTCEILIKQRQRIAKIDGKNIKTTENHFQSLPMVLFHPQIMELVQGSPDSRRRFIDRALFQANKIYPSIYRDYMRVLQTRNKVLKNQPIDKRVLIPLNIQISQLGCLIVSMRDNFIKEMNPFFKHTINEISDGAEGDLKYQPSITGDEQDFLKKIENNEKIDVFKKYTSAGPHTDDIGFYLASRDAKKYASQGQQRTVVLAAKIAEIKALTKSTNKIPLLLLDDVSSELDKDRNKRLFDFLQNLGGQVFITSTHKDYIHIKENRRDFFVEEGRIVQMEKSE